MNHVWFEHCRYSVVPKAKMCFEDIDKFIRENAASSIVFHEWIVKRSLKNYRLVFSCFQALLSLSSPFYHALLFVFHGLYLLWDLINHDCTLVTSCTFSLCVNAKVPSNCGACEFIVYECGHKCAVYHGSMDPNQRAWVQRQWCKDVITFSFKAMWHLEWVSTFVSTLSCYFEYLIITFSFKDNVIILFSNNFNIFWCISSVILVNAIKNVFSSSINLSFTYFVFFKVLIFVVLRNSLNIF